jgi:hypothetical protein
MDVGLSKDRFAFQNRFTTAVVEGHSPTGKKIFLPAVIPGKVQQLFPSALNRECQFGEKEDLR